MTIIVNQNRFFKMMLSNLSTYTKHTTIDYSALKKIEIDYKTTSLFNHRKICYPLCIRKKHAIHIKDLKQTPAHRLALKSCTK